MQPRFADDGVQTAFENGTTPKNSAALASDLELSLSSLPNCSFLIFLPFLWKWHPATLAVWPPIGRVLHFGLENISE